MIPKKYERMIKKLSQAGISCIINCKIVGRNDGTRGDFINGTNVISNLDRIELASIDNTAIHGCLYTTKKNEIMEMLERNKIKKIP